MVQISDTTALEPIFKLGKKPFCKWINQAIQITSGTASAYSYTSDS